MKEIFPPISQSKNFQSVWTINSVLMANCMLLSVARSISAQISYLFNESSYLLPPFLAQDLKQIQRTLKRLTATFEDADERSTRDRSVELWLRELKCVAYEADDVVGLCGYEMLRAEVLARNSVSLGGVKRKLMEVQDLNSYLVIPDELVKQVREKLTELLRDMKSLILKDNDKKVHQLCPTNYPPTSSWHLSPHFVFGRENEKEYIVTQMLQNGTNNSSGGDMTCVLPIVGMGGIGKTTVAQLVYDDHRIAEMFDLRGWVHVSEDFDVVTLTKKIIESFSHVSCDLVQLSSLQERLMLLVRGKTFLLVLDDVWNEQRYLWELFLVPFVGAQSGNIIVTTRSQRVAHMTSTVPSCILCGLTFEDSWVLFRRIVSDSQDISVRDKLLDTGRVITTKCMGLPLAIRAIASFLRFYLDEDTWMDVLESDLWEIDEYWGSILPHLKLSYEHMPINLKQCFLFFSLYPKGHVFFKEDQIRLWLSVGLLHHEHQEPKYIGSLFFDELVQRSIIEPYHVGKGRNGGFYMHDLMHDLVLFYAKEEFSIVKHEDDIKSLSLGVRYLSLHVPGLPESIDRWHLSGLRFLQILFQGSEPNHVGVKIKIPENLFIYLVHIRSLILRDNLIEALPDSIGDLKLLCYLDLANTGIESLPDSVCNLYNLQTLDLTNCPIQELPSGIGNLVRLQELIFQQSFSMCMPRGIGKLTRLRTLSRFDIKRGSWHCTLSELKDLVSLREELCIAGLNNVANVKEANDANLENKMHLNVLILDWSTGPTCSHHAELEGTSNDLSSEQGLVANSELHAKLLEGLQPHKNLKKLHIHEYCGSKFPSWLGDSYFSNLAEISIKSCKSDCELIPSLGELPSLKNLRIESMEGVYQVGREFCSLDGAEKGFRSLETLSFRDMKNWVYWNSVRSSEFCSLQTLRMVDCPKLESLPDPLSSSLTKLVIKDCDKLAKIPTLPSLSFLILSGQMKEGILAFSDLPILKALKVSDSRNTRSLDVNRVKFPLLEVLVIRGCRNLQSIAGLDGLSSLKTIKISACQNMQFSLKQKFPSTLENLDISNCPQLEKWKETRETTYYDQLYKNCGASDEILQELELFESDSEDDDSD